MTTQPPWASGPGEILQHGLTLLKKDTDSNRRLAMISIDNAVELMMKTYLGLPRRVTGLKITRSEYQEFAESFPKLLDALEKYANNKIDGIDLGEIEWYHRIRNELYHQGNGLTVERDKVEIYAELANVLFTNLFGIRLIDPEENALLILGEFMQTWVEFEKILTDAMPLINDPRKRPFSPLQSVDALENEGLLSKVEIKEINQIRRLRNEIVHGIVNHKDVLTPEITARLKAINYVLQKRIHDEIKS